MTHLIRDKGLDCLRFIACNPRREYKQWASDYQELCSRWSEKAVTQKLDDLSAKGYIDYGVSPRMGWLTDKGRAALES